jgi:hypothetical protein
VSAAPQAQRSRWNVSSNRKRFGGCNGPRSEDGAQEASEASGSAPHPKTT